MSKVLISFLGTAMPKNREYRLATYHFDDGDLKTYPFIAKALKEHYGIDRIILIGTIKSMWEEVYRQFATEQNILDEQAYVEISDCCVKSDHKSELILPHQSDIENVLGTGSKIVLIKYGLNKEEIEYNSSAIFQIEQYLHRKDELYVDITHSFRSLPLLLMNSLIYLKTVSPKQISISNISYGMLDITDELGYTPVVDLSEIMKTNDWISGAYSLMEFGNAYKIADLLFSDNYKDEGNRLTKFSDVMNMNHLSSIRTQLQELQSFRNKQLPPIASMLIVPIINQFQHYFEGCDSLSKFELLLSKWHFERHNYSSAYIVFVESIISYVCEKEKTLDENIKNDRDAAKIAIIKGSKYKYLRHLYEKMRKTRNTIAHNIEKKESINKMIADFDTNFKYFESFFNL